jgi:hypothetical protein
LIAPEFRGKIVALGGLMPAAALKIAVLPASPARSILAQAIAETKAASDSLALAEAPVAKLQAIIAAAEQALAQLTERQRDDEAILGDWLAAGGAGERPAPVVQTLSAERRVAELPPDAAAGRRALRELLDRRARAAWLTRPGATREAGALRTSRQRRSRFLA